MRKCFVGSGLLADLSTRSTTNVGILTDSWNGGGPTFVESARLRRTSPLFMLRIIGATKALRVARLTRISWCRAALNYWWTHTHSRRFGAPRHGAAGVVTMSPPTFERVSHSTCGLKIRVLGFTETVGNIKVCLRLKMLDVKMTDHQNCTAWNCRTWTWRTKNDGRAWNCGRKSTLQWSVQIL